MAFRMDTTTKPGSSGFHIAMDKASGEKPYLGDPEVIESLVRALVAGAGQRFGEVADGEFDQTDAVATDRAGVLDLAAILCGQNDAYETVGDWNPNGLAAAVRENLADSIEASAATDAVDAVQQACAILLLEVYEVMGTLAQDGDEEAAKDALTGVVGDFTNLFAGLPVDGDSQEQQGQAT
jgi:hypothetical protein